LAVANEETVHIVYPGLSTNEVNQTTKDLISASSKTYQVEAAASDKKEVHCTWEYK